MEYSVQVKREVLVSVQIKAMSPQEALQKYRQGSYNSQEEDILDSSDIEEPIITPVAESESQDEYPGYDGIPGYDDEPPHSWAYREPVDNS